MGSKLRFALERARSHPLAISSSILGSRLSNGRSSKRTNETKRRELLSLDSSFRDALAAHFRKAEVSIVSMSEIQIFRAEFSRIVASSIIRFELNCHTVC